MTQAHLLALVGVSAGLLALALWLAFSRAERR